MLIELKHLESPVGNVLIAASAEGLHDLYFTDTEAIVRKRYPDATFGEGRHADAVSKRIQAYFEGDLSALEEIKVAATGTEFQKKVWAALREIPMGATTSYSRLAARIGNPTAVRAVGAANGRNPISLVVPCHRVIAADGTLCGYAGGLWRKQWLLKHERALLA